LKSANYHWAVLFVSFLTFVAYAFVFQLMPPLLKTVAAGFAVGDAQAGLLISMAVVPGIFLALPVGLIVNKYGFRLLGFLSTILVAAGSFITALADTFAIALLGRFLLGVGGTFIIVGLPTLIPQWFPHKDLGKAMGVYGTNMPVATIMAFAIAPVLLQSFNDWHYPFYVGTAVALVIAVIFASVIKEGPLKGEHKPVDSREVKQAIMNGEVWKASLVWMLFNTTAIAFLSWAPTLFREFKHLELLYASLLASVLMYTAVVFAPLFGWASDRSGKRKPFMVVGSIAMGLALIATSYASGSTLLLSVLVLGIAAATVPPIVFTIPPKSLPSNLAGTAFSIITLCQNIGITFAAPFGGYLIQTTGDLTKTFFGISLFAFAAAITTLTLKTK
jgi:MFS family permease